jgi:hypothetical protein
MTPQEKADELHVGYWRLTNNARIAKECALMAVNELIKQCSDANSWYWEEVKIEINKL